MREKQVIAVEETGERSLLDAFVSQLIAIASQISQNPTTQDILAFTPVQSHLQEVAENYTEGLQDDDLLWAFVGLARFYKEQGLYAEAEAWYEQCLRTTENRFEGDHPDVASSLNNLAAFYRAQGRLSEAELLYVQSLEMYQRLFEGDYPDVASTLNNLAYLYHTQGCLSEAESQYEQALAMFERTLGIDHPDTQTVRENLASLRQQMRSLIYRPRRRSFIDRLLQKIRQLV